MKSPSRKRRAFCLRALRYNHGMGLRALAYYFDRSEALVVRGALEAAGILAIIGNEDFLRVWPHYIGPLSGYRVLVLEFEVEDAVAVIEEALAHPIEEGEILVVRGGFFDRVQSFLMGWFSGGVPTPIRQWTWRER